MNILVTGANGFVGSELVKALKMRQDIQDIIGVDIAKQARSEGIIYYQCDIRDSKLSEIVKKHNIDSVVHLASIVSPTKEMTREFLHSVDVGGTKNILETCVNENINHIVIASSGASYGYHPDNPKWLSEDDQLRGNKEFAYSDHKREVEEILADYRKQYPQLKQLILRPGTILGNTVNNQITDLFSKKFVMGIKGHDTPFVFIWDEDFIEIMCQGVIHKKEGIYNIAGDGTLTLKEIATILKKPYLPIPYSFMFTALSLLKTFKLTQYGPNMINFLRYRPVLSNKALKEKFKYIPNKTTKESFLCYLQNKNISL
ncbi:MAG: SDR family oxidoreductase [Bacteriovoracaceae bacterium]|jgi:UDP-glucose 4-epimerase|nr:SDR family oxidoreductase [Bacteriovoracaceae bacterium]